MDHADNDCVDCVASSADIPISSHDDDGIWVSRDVAMDALAFHVVSSVTSASSSRQTMEHLTPVQLHKILVEAVNRIDNQ